jgi:type IV secretion system protein VirD4
MSPPPAAPLPDIAPPDPMAGFANGPELGRYAMREGGFFLGRVHEDHGHSFPAGISDDRHLFLVAGTRSGKGLTVGIPNALTWQGPLFMIDPKGEAASICALRRGSLDDARGTGTSVRSFIGQKVAVLDPLGQVRGPSRVFSVAYNPLSDIALAEGGGVRSIQALAASIIQTEEGNAAHFAETAETILAGVIEAVKSREPVHRQTLPQCRSIMMAGFDQLREYLAAVDTPAGLAQEAATIMDEVGGDEWGSHRSTLSRNLKWLADPNMQAHLAPSAFSMREAVRDGWSIFVALPPEQIAPFKSWLRLVVRAMLDAKMSLGVNQKGPQTLCLLDEFPTLGRFKIIEESAGYMAGYGLKLVPIIQNIGQLRELYNRNWETFLGNAGAIVAFGLNDLETEKYISDRLGKEWVTESSITGSNGTSSQFMGAGANVSQSYSTARHERPVRFPNEIHEQGARETGRAFVIPASGRGFTIRRQSYADFPAGMFDAPDFITHWERQHWREGE